MEGCTIVTCAKKLLYILSRSLLYTFYYIEGCGAFSFLVWNTYVDKLFVVQVDAETFLKLKS
jgi:hypothetical protein